VTGVQTCALPISKLKDYIYHLIRHAPAICPVCEGTGFAR
jgi:hypothetical protein